MCTLFYIDFYNLPWKWHLCQFLCIHQSVFTESVKSWFLNKMRCWVTSYRIRKHFYFSLNSSKGFQLNKCKCLLNYWWHNVVSIFIICGIYSIAWKQILYFVRLLNALYSHVICWLARRFLTVGLETSNQLIFWWQKTV